MSIEEIRSRWVLAGGVKTHYSEAGDGDKNLVALHGGGAGSSGKAGMGLVMPYLAKDCRVLAPDSIGGFGLTDPAAPTPYGLISRTHHTADFIDALALDKVNLIGNSQGAWSACQYAMMQPDRVEKIIIVSSLTIAWSMGIDQKPNDTMRALIGYDGTRDAMKRLLEAIIVDPSRITDELIDERQAAATRPGAWEAFQNMAKSIAKVKKDPILSMQTDWSESMPILTKHIPTLILWGTADNFATPDTAEALKDKLPDARFEWVEGAGHQVQTDEPEKSAEIIRDFLNE